MRKRIVITLLCLVVACALVVAIKFVGGSQPVSVELTMSELRTMNIGEALGQRPNNWDPVEFAVFTITNTGGQRVLVGRGDTQVKEDDRWQNVHLFKSSLNIALERHQSVEFNVQTVDDERPWRLQIGYYVEAPIAERFKMRVRDAWRAKTLTTNFLRPVWSGNFAVTKTYKRQGTNIIEQP